MNKTLCIIALFTTFFGVAQKKDKALKESNNLVYQANQLVDKDFVSAEMEYRKALSEKPTNTAGAYNLGSAYYQNKKLSEAKLRLEAAAKSATSKTEKHKIYHNLGNTLMQGKKCQEAVEAYKNALRNDPTDDETRYNLGLAKECAKQQGGGGGGEDDKKKDQDDQKQQEQQQKQDQNQKQQNQDNKQNDQQNQDQDSQDKKKGDQDQDDKGKPDDKNKDQGQGEKEQKKPRQQQGQLSPQQIKNLLQAMDDHEQKVQDKMNAQKAQGVKVQTDKDW